MLRIISSTAAEPAEGFREARRAENESNVAWVERQINDPEAGLTAPTGDGSAQDAAPTLVLLTGGRTQTAFRLRVAQSHLRDDLTPSQWSHAALMRGLPAADAGTTPLFEIALEPPMGFGFAPVDNGLQNGRMGTYDDPERYPNIALMRVPVPAQDWLEPTADGQMSVLDRFKKQRSVLDATDLILAWLAFVWGVGQAGNPLLDEKGVPSAALVETVLSATHYDITPGSESRASSPEGIWQAARWWHPYYREQDRDPIRGRWHVGHRLAAY